MVFTTCTIFGPPPCAKTLFIVVSSIVPNGFAQFAVVAAKRPPPTPSEFLDFRAEVDGRLVALKLNKRRFISCNHTKKGLGSATAAAGSAELATGRAQKCGRGVSDQGRMTKTLLPYVFCPLTAIDEVLFTLQKCGTDRWTWEMGEKGPDMVQNGGQSKSQRWKARINKGRPRNSAKLIQLVRKAMEALPASWRRSDGSYLPTADWIEKCSVGRVGRVPHRFPRRHCVHGVNRGWWLQ